MKDTFKICVLASGGGGNFQALINNQDRIGYSIVKLITDRECGAVERAKNNRIDFVILDKYKLGAKFFDFLDKEISTDVDLIVCAGFMPIIPKNICNKFHRKIINTHPSLLPAYGGKGMYGVLVQEAVLRNKEEYAGCTVHFVNEKIDGGEIILQKKIKTITNESAWDLGGRIFLEENKLLPEAIGLLINSKE